MIGDKSVDIDAAAANAIPSIGVTWGYGTRDEISYATFLVESVGVPLQRSHAKRAI